MLESNVVGYIPVTSEIEALAKIDFIVSTELLSEEEQFILLVWLQHTNHS